MSSKDFIDPGFFINALLLPRRASANSLRVSTRFRQNGRDPGVGSAALARKVIRATACAGKAKRQKI
jgi:hypothetical protein